MARGFVGVQWAAMDGETGSVGEACAAKAAAAVLLHQDIHNAMSLLAAKD